MWTSFWYCACCQGNPAETKSSTTWNLYSIGARPPNPPNPPPHPPLGFYTEESPMLHYSKGGSLGWLPSTATVNDCKSRCDQLGSRCIGFSYCNDQWTNGACDLRSQVLAPTTQFSKCSVWTKVDDLQVLRVLSTSPPPPSPPPPSPSPPSPSPPPPSPSPPPPPLDCSKLVADGGICGEGRICRNCCSREGFCGSSIAYCGTGNQYGYSATLFLQAEFGSQQQAATSPPPPPSPPLSPPVIVEGSNDAVTRNGYDVRCGYWSGSNCLQPEIRPTGTTAWARTYADGTSALLYSRAWCWLATGSDAVTAHNHGSLQGQVPAEFRLGLRANMGGQHRSRPRIRLNLPKPLFSGTEHYQSQATTNSYQSSCQCTNWMPPPPPPLPLPPPPPDVRAVDILCPMDPPSPPPLPSPPPPGPSPPPIQPKCSCPEDEFRQRRLKESPPMSLQEWTHAVTEGPLIRTPTWSAKLQQSAADGYAKVGICPDATAGAHAECVWSTQAVELTPILSGWLMGATGKSRAASAQTTTASPEEGIHFVPDEHVR